MARTRSNLWFPFAVLLFHWFLCILPGSCQQYQQQSSPVNLNLQVSQLQAMGVDPSLYPTMQGASWGPPPGPGGGGPDQYNYIAQQLQNIENELAQIKQKIMGEPVSQEEMNALRSRIFELQEEILRYGSLQLPVELANKLWYLPKELNYIKNFLNAQLLKQIDQIIFEIQKLKSSPQSAKISLQLLIDIEMKLNRLKIDIQNARSTADIERTKVIFVKIQQELDLLLRKNSGSGFVAGILSRIKLYIERLRGIIFRHMKIIIMFG